MTTFTLHKVTIPADIADPEAADFIEAIELGNTVNSWNTVEMPAARAAARGQGRRPPGRSRHLRNPGRR